MNCTCITDVEKKLAERVIQPDLSPPRGKPLKRVFCKHMALMLRSGTIKLQIPFDCEWEGQKKPTTVFVTAAYCPFCGTKVDDEPAKL